MIFVVPFCISIPESEARYRDALSKMVSEPSLEEAFALSGLEGEGREVERVSLAPVRDAASALPVNTNKSSKATKNNAFDKNFIHLPFKPILTSVVK